MENDPIAPGFSDVGTRNILYTLILSLRPESVLEIGSHIGFGTLVMVQALKANGFGKLFVVEPQEVYLGQVHSYLKRAGLDGQVNILRGFSSDNNIRKALQEQRSFEIIFVDACHDFADVLAEINFYSGLLSQNGLMVFHDSSIGAQALDSKKEGGVRQAILAACRENSRLKPIFLEYPLWPNPQGLAIVCNQEIAL